MTAEHDAIHLMAADWVARLREPGVSLEETLAWQSWMGEDPRHAEAFARMEEVSSVLRAMPLPARPRGPVAGSDRYDASVPIGDWHATTRRPKIALATAAAILMAAIVLGWTAFDRQSLSWNGMTARLQTAVGENRMAQLGDGSYVTLGGNTKVSIDLSDKARRVDLVYGEAFFKVAKDPSRPFSVHAGDATVIAVGTEFNVRRGRDRVAVTVIEGRVIVEPETRILPLAVVREFKPKFVAVNLEAGEQTTAGGNGVEAAARLSDPTAAMAWQTGRLAFRLEPLRYVLEDVNRYAPKPIVIADKRVAALRFTGTVMGNNVKGWVGSLESALGIEAVEEPNRIVLKRKL